MLEHGERRDGDQEYGGTDQHARRNERRGAVARSRQQQCRTRHDEYQLGGRPNGDVHDHAGGRLHARHAAQAGQPHTGEITADARNRQKRVDGFANPTNPDNGGDIRTSRWRQQLAPGERAHQQWNQMEQGDGKEPPPNDVQRVNHVRGAAGDDQVKHKQKAASGGDDQRTTYRSEPSFGHARGSLSPCGEGYHLVGEGSAGESSAEVAMSYTSDGCPVGRWLVRTGPKPGDSTEPEIHRLGGIILHARYLPDIRRATALPVMRLWLSWKALPH